MQPSPISTTAPTTTSAVPSPRLAPPVHTYASSIASNPRGSISQTDLHSDLRALREKAKRWEDGGEGPTGSAAETAVDVDLDDVVERGMYGSILYSLH